MSKQAVQTRYGTTSLVGRWLGRWTPADDDVLDRAGDRHASSATAPSAPSTWVLALVTAERGIADEVLRSAPAPITSGHQLHVSRIGRT